MILDYILGRHLPDEKSPDEWDLPAFDLDLKEYFGIEPGSFDFSEKTREQIREELAAEPARASTSRRRRSSARDDAAPREVRDAPDRRPAVEGPPPRHRPPEGGHRPAGLRPARPARRVQEGVLRALHAHEGADRGPDRSSTSSACSRSCGKPSRREPRGPAPCRRSPPAARPATSTTPTARPLPVDRTRRSRPCTARRPKVGRNDPCPCGSGKKYKKCHGAAAAGG